MTTLPTDYSREQLIDALLAEYRECLDTMSDAELQAESSVQVNAMHHDFDSDAILSEIARY